MVLVTGGTGFLGSYLIRYLVKEGFQIRALKRPASDLSLLAEAKDRVDWVEGDVLDLPSLEAAFEGIEKVYHVASVVAHDAASRKRMFKTNVEGTANIVNLGLEKGIKKLLYVGSTSALQNRLAGGLINEDFEPEKTALDSSYGVTKFLGETEVWRGIAEGLNAVIVNPAMLVGAGKWNDTSVRIFREVAKGQLFYPLGSNGYADVRDAAKIIIRLMESELSGQRFIISAENKTYREVIDEIADRLGVRRPAFPLNNWLIPAGKTFEFVRGKLTGTSPIFTADVAQITSRMAQYDNSKIKAALNYSFIPVSEALKQAAEKYKAHPQKEFAVLDL